MDIWAEIKDVLPAKGRERVISIVSSGLTLLPAYILSLYTTEIGNFVKEGIVSPAVVFLLENKLPVGTVALGLFFHLRSLYVERVINSVPSGKCIKVDAGIPEENGTDYHYNVTVSNWHWFRTISVTCNESKLEYGPNGGAVGTLIGPGVATIGPMQSAVFQFSAPRNVTPCRVSVSYKVHIDGEKVPVAGSQERMSVGLPAPQSILVRAAQP